MDGFFRQFGIYSSEGQKYTPEDADKVMWYRESKDGIMLEEGTNEAGAFQPPGLLWLHHIQQIIFP